MDTPAITQESKYQDPQKFNTQAIAEEYVSRHGGMVIKNYDGKYLVLYSKKAENGK